MRVGLCTVWLFIPESNSLKAKRQVIKSIANRLKNRFNISIAEVDALDAHQEVVLGIVTVSNDARHVNRVLSYVVNFIEDSALAVLTDYQIEMLC